MGEVVRLPTPADSIVARWSHAELRAEWRRQEDDLMAVEDDFKRIAFAVWPVDSERPESLAEGTTTAAEIVAGVRSLHELGNRLFQENARLRAELAEVRRG